MKMHTVSPETNHYHLYNVSAKAAFMEMDSIAKREETVFMEVTFVQEMEDAWSLTEHFYATAMQGGSETAFSVRMWMNVKNKVITVALMQNVLMYQENTNVSAKLDGWVMAIFVQTLMNASSIRTRVVRTRTA